MEKNMPPNAEDFSKAFIKMLEEAKGYEMPILSFEFTYDPIDVTESGTTSSFYTRSTMFVPKARVTYKG